MGARGEMDITIDYGSVVRGSNPCGRTMAALIYAANMLSVRRISFGHAPECAFSVSAPQAQHLDCIYQRSLRRGAFARDGRSLKSEACSATTRVLRSLKGEAGS